MKNQGKRISRRDSLKLAAGLTASSIVFGIGSARASERESFRATPEQRGFIVLDKITLEKRIAIDPTRNWRVFPIGVTFQEKEEDLLAKVEFMLWRPYKQNDPITIQSEMTLYDPHGVTLNQAHSIVTEKDIDIVHIEKGVIKTTDFSGSLKFKFKDVRGKRLHSYRLAIV